MFVVAVLYVTVNIPSKCTPSSSCELLRVTSELITEVDVAMAADDGKATLRPNTVLTAVVANDFDVSSLQRDIVIYSERDGETLEAPIAAGTVLYMILVQLVFV